MPPSHTVPGQTLWQWRRDAQQQAIAADVPVAEVDWLLQYTTGLDRLTLRLESFQERAEIPLGYALDTLTQLWRRRLAERVPVQYLVGITPWRQFSLMVSPAVLIPRPETEALIDRVIAAVASRGAALANGLWTDLGTGSGAIALGLADAFPEMIVHAVDCSAAALAVAQKNAQLLGLDDRIRFHHGSWFEPLAQLRGQLSGMVANPPYIPSAMIADLQPEVGRHEPHLALDGGEDGLDCIRHLVATAPEYLVSGGMWLIEIMAGQADAVVEQLQAQRQYCQIQVHQDLAGIDRFVQACRV